MTKKKTAYIGCTIKSVPPEQILAAAKTAIEINPANRPHFDDFPAGLVGTMIATVLPPEHLAVITSRFWGAGGVKLGVSFMENTAAALRDKILSYMNAWSAFCNASFSWSQSNGEVRISRGQGGYYSYLGSDILHIPKNQQTMNLQGFVLNTPESEYKRVVKHETGHTLGFPHEHMRKQLVQRLDPQKTITYFQQTQGWSPTMTQQQVLTPLDEESIMGTPAADEDSIMCYALPAQITRDNKPIRGGVDIEAQDQAFAAKLYPLAVTPPPPPPPPPTGGGTSIAIPAGAKNVTVGFN